MPNDIKLYRNAEPPQPKLDDLLNHAENQRVSRSSTCARNECIWLVCLSCDFLGYIFLTHKGRLFNTSYNNYENHVEMKYDDFNTLCNK